ncbi:hypothetical protein ACUL41_07035 [Virgibacillus natechei]
MNINEALKAIDWRKAEYFKWKHGVRYQQGLEKKTEGEFLHTVQRKTLNPYLAWERSSEYKQLLTLLLESRIAEDMQDIYNTVSEKAKEGDEKSVKLFLSMQKEINNNAKIAKKALESVQIEEDDDDLLID